MAQKRKGEWREDWRSRKALTRKGCGVSWVEQFGLYPTSDGESTRFPTVISTSSMSSPVLWELEIWEYIAQISCHQHSNSKLMNLESC